jgi:transposase
MRMLTADISPGPEGFEHRTFECLNCGHTEQRIFGL